MTISIMKLLRNLSEPPCASNRRDDFVILEKPQRPYFMRLGNSKLLQVSPKATRTAIMCVSEGGYPPANFTWQRNGQKLKPDKSVTIQNQSSRSQLSILTKMLRNRDILTCIVTNEAMMMEVDHQSRDYRLSITVQLAKAPGQPIIRGLRSSKSYRVGEQLQLSCWATAVSISFYC